MVMSKLKEEGEEKGLKKMPVTENGKEGRSLFVVYDAWTTWIPVRCAVDDGLIIHDYTDKKSRQAPESYRSTRRNRKNNS